ncbi:MAG: DUF4344 domain-containing metallopeptidase [Prevotella sp.]|jgi:Zn-dependent peptidase ImmA (M78 family)|nr:DUF4344 domain-containing metallopeptidase [Prevotella sp.]
MDKENIEFRKILDLSVSDTGNMSDDKSIKELFEDKLRELNITQNQALKLLSMEAKTLRPILENTAKRIDVVNIIKLGHFLGLSVNEIMKMYIPEMDIEQIGEIQKAREASFLLENFDIQSLIKSKFIDSKSISNVKQRVNTFFGLSTIYDFSENKVFPAFSRSKKTSNDKVRDFWLKAAYSLFKDIANPYEYNRQKLIELLPKIRPYSRDEENGLTIVAKALYTVGITVIFQPSIANLQVKGATFIIDGRPCIVLSNLNKRYPTLWFVLLHELHHVLYDFDDISVNRYHLTGEMDLFLLNEDAADNFAKEYFLSEDRLNFISPYINSRATISKYSKEWSVHVSFIYAFYCQEKNAWGHPVSKLIPSSEIALKYLNTHPFERETLAESAKQLKELVYNI